MTVRIDLEVTNAEDVWRLLDNLADLIYKGEDINQVIENEDGKLRSVCNV